MNAITAHGKITKQGVSTGETKDGKQYCRFSISDYQGKNKTQFLNVFCNDFVAKYFDGDAGDIVVVYGKLSIEDSEKYGKTVTIFANSVSNCSSSGGGKKKDDDDEGLPF